MQQLQLNTIPFTPVVNKITLPFYKEYQNGFNRFITEYNFDELLDDKFTKLDKLDYPFLYTDFKEPKDGAIILEIDLSVNKNFAAHYYRSLIFNYFKNGVADIMHRNFVDDVELWFLNPKVKNPNFNLYEQFTIKIQHNNISGNPEIVISYDGTSKVYKKSIAEMVGFDTTHFNMINCRGILHSFEHLPEEDKLHHDKNYPVLSNELKTILGISPDIPDLNNRYPKYFEALNNFYEKYLNNDDFKKVIPIHKDGFVKLKDEQIQVLHGDSQLLQFGKNTGREPKTDLKSYGPFKPVPPPNNVKFFFIYQRADMPKVEKIKKDFIEGLGYHPNLQRFISLPFSFDDSLNISFNDLIGAVSNTYHALKDRKKDPQTKYFAIYISPISKLETDFEKKRIYFRIKEMLLTYGYLSQVIYQENIFKDSFKYFLPNIQIAMLAKLGGIPWRLRREIDNELIVGIGAFNSITKKSKYVGSAFCFNNIGEFKGFDCFGSKDTDALAGSIRQAVEAFLETNKSATRLIIHFYKTMSKRELKPILNTLYHDLKLSIPVIIVTINKTASKDLLAFDIADKTNLMPYSGTYVNVGEREYLLFNNTRYTEASKPTPKEYHFPVKLKLTSTNLELLEDKSLVDLLIDQVYQFSRMYWKSVSQQNLPVTISYPEMVAMMFPYFKHDTIPQFGKENLWFL